MRGFIILARFEFYYIRLQNNLAQDQSNNKLISSANRVVVSLKGYSQAQSHPSPLSKHIMQLPAPFLIFNLLKKI